MKKSIIVLVLAVLGIAGLSSCEKQGHRQPPVVTNLNITLQKNEAYTFTLPANTTPAPYRTTTEAKHYSISLVSKDASGKEVYQYTPALDYTGTDNVSIENTPMEKCGGGGHHGGGGNDGDEDDVQPNVVNINFTIGTSTSNTDRTEVVSTVSGSSK